MIWLAWRQHRAQALATAGLIAALCGFLVHQGRTVHSVFDATLGPCLAQGGDCQELVNAFGDRFSGMLLLIPIVLVLPLLLGLFWGAPLVARELEQGTFRLAWTQTVTPRRWLLAKVGALALAAAALAAVYALVSTWFASPFTHANSSRLAPGVFDLQGVVPVAYTLFALALGVAAGAVVRRVLPSMAVTLAGFALVRLVVATWARPRFQPASVHRYPIVGGTSRADVGDWVVEARIVDGQGRVFSHGGQIDITPAKLAEWCPGVGADLGAVKTCIGDVLRLQGVESYHPASQFWGFQAVEAALFLALAAVCVAFAAWWVRRRSS